VSIKKVTHKNAPIISQCDVLAVKQTKLFLFNLILSLKYKKLLFSGTCNDSVAVIMVVLVAVVVMSVCVCVRVCVCVSCRSEGISVKKIRFIKVTFPLFVEDRTIATSLYV
jgi:hypothetical protein